MIIVDTNVWSETLRQTPDARVLAWLRTEREQLHLSTITAHELRFGVERLPDGRRKDALTEQIDTLLAGMRSRTLNYDAEAASAHALIRVSAERVGRGLSGSDGQILGIAAAQGAAVATRNVSDFEGFGVSVIDPWGR
ncbi:MAG: type II toxin-antitoxin system VapC family toxin [Leucobacter sp.]